MTIIEMKKVLYLLQTIFGVFLCYIGLQSFHSPDPVQMLAGWILTGAGTGLFIFGVLTFLLRDDPDIWR